MGACASRTRRVYAGPPTLRLRVVAGRRTREQAAQQGDHESDRAATPATTASHRRPPARRRGCEPERRAASSCTGTWISTKRRALGQSTAGCMRARGRTTSIHDARRWSSVAPGDQQIRTPVAADWWRSEHCEREEHDEEPSGQPARHGDGRPRRAGATTPIQNAACASAEAERDGDHAESGAQRPAGDHPSEPGTARAPCPTPLSSTRGLVRHARSSDARLGR